MDGGSNYPIIRHVGEPMICTIDQGDRYARHYLGRTAVFRHEDGKVTIADADGVIRVFEGVVGVGGPHPIDEMEDLDCSDRAGRSVEEYAALAAVGEGGSIVDGVPV